MVTEGRMCSSLRTMKRLAWLALLGTLAACGGRYGAGSAPEPQSPNAALEQFLAAVKAKDTHKLEELWGNDNGTVLGRKNFPDSAVEQTVRLFQVYFAHEGYRIVDGPATSALGPTIVTFHVELHRANHCTVVVPIDLHHTHPRACPVLAPHFEAAGNPAKPCAGPGPGT